MKQFPTLLKERLQKLDEAQCRRRLSLRSGIDFSSNDYLGFSEDPELRSLAQRSLEMVPLGASGSRLLRGHLSVFEEAEKVLAEFCGRESALIYCSGYQANVGLLSALLGVGDTVYSDQLNHASIIDGIKLSGAQRRIYLHSDVAHLRQLLEADSECPGLKVVVTESLYGMDGDVAPLLALADLAEEHSALLIVDEAHATGIWGDFEQNQGGGWVQKLGLTQRVFATIHPAGKAMGLSGAWVCGDGLLKEYLVNSSRAFIFSTAPLPVLPALLMASVQHWRRVGRGRAKKLLENALYFQESLNFKAVKPGPIIPIILGENSRALHVAQELQALGFDVRAIRPPTVPEGTARLRITLNCNHRVEDLDRVGGLIRLAISPTQSTPQKNHSPCHPPQ